MAQTKMKQRIIVQSLDEIPVFESEDEEREWWAKHDLSEELYDSLDSSADALNRVLPLSKRAKAKKAKPR